MPTVTRKSAPDGIVKAVQTTDATLTTIATVPLADDTAYQLTAFITGRRTNAAGRAVYRREAAVYREAAGSAVMEGPVGTPLSRESTGGYNATIEVSGNNALIRVQGAGGHDINWRVMYFLTKVA